MRPGGPPLFGSWKGTPIFGLPGNPVSSHVVFTVLVSEWISKCMGADQVTGPRLDAVEEICAQYGGAGDAYDAAVIPSDLDLDGTCDTVDPDDDGDGYPDPACVFSDFGGSPSQLEYVECAVSDEDRFPLDPSEWYDGNGDMRGDNAFPPKEELPGFGLLLTLVALTIGAVIRRPLRA